MVTVFQLFKKQNKQNQFSVKEAGLALRLPMCATS